MSAQLSLPLSLRVDATFDNFLATDAARGQVKSLLEFGRADAQFIFLWGGDGCGRSHLAQAACHRHVMNDASAQFLPAGELGGFDASSLLEGLDELALVCVDDVHTVAGSPGWERELFNLFNRMAGRGNKLVVTAGCAPGQLPYQLADLVSRFSSGLTFHLLPYSDEDKKAILRYRAGGLGIDLSDDVSSYLLARCSRQLEDILAVLRQLDEASLAAKRRVTIPFIKEFFGW